jgi:hypothetical protein
MKQGNFIVIGIRSVYGYDLTTSRKIFLFPFYLNLYYKVKLFASLLWRLLPSLFNSEPRPTVRMTNTPDNEDPKGVFG